MTEALESERGVLGLCLVWGELAPEIRDALTPEMFRDSRHREVFTSVLELLKSQGAVDELSVTQALKAAGQLGEIGGPTFIDEICRTRIQKEHLSYHLGQVKRAHYADRMAILAGELAKDPSDECLAELQKLAILRSQADGQRIFDLSRNLPDYLDAMDKGREPTIETGLQELDRLLGGLKRGDLFTVSARPGGGKTAFLTRVAVNVAERGLSVLIFSTEMQAAQFVGRVLPAMAGVSAWKFRKGSIAGDDRQRLTEACAGIHGKLKIHVIDKARPDLGDVRAAIARVKPDVVICDYLQRFAKPRAENTTREIDAFMTGLKTIAIESKVVIFLGCQMNRIVDRDDGGTPKLSDLRDGGAIEAEADQVLLLSRKTKDTMAPVTEIVGHLEKNRHGFTGAVSFALNRELVDFGEMEPENAPNFKKVPSHGLVRKEAMAADAYMRESE
ncbi:MAG: AAA family ATPase [Elusimicrobia bacterium]|nr:AAA family ATPase [Elusimicrobiota bacterium]